MKKYLYSKKQVIDMAKLLAQKVSESSKWIDYEELEDLFASHQRTNPPMQYLELSDDAALHLRHILEVTEGEHVAGMLEQLQDLDKFETADFTARYHLGVLDIRMKPSNPFYGGKTHGGNVASMSEARDVQAQLQAISDWEAEKRK